MLEVDACPCETMLKVCKESSVIGVYNYSELPVLLLAVSVRSSVIFINENED